MLKYTVHLFNSHETFINIICLHFISRVQPTLHSCNNTSISSHNAYMTATHKFNKVFLELKIWSFFLSI